MSGCRNSSGASITRARMRAGAVSRVGQPAARSVREPPMPSGALARCPPSSHPSRPRSAATRTRCPAVAAPRTTPGESNQRRWMIFSREFLDIRWHNPMTAIGRPRRSYPADRPTASRRPHDGVVSTSGARSGYLPNDCAAGSFRSVVFVLPEGAAGGPRGEHSGSPPMYPITCAANGLAPVPEPG